MFNERSCEAKEANFVPSPLEYEILFGCGHQTSVRMYCIRQQPGESAALGEVDQGLFPEIKVFLEM